MLLLCVEKKSQEGVWISNGVDLTQGRNTTRSGNTTGLQTLKNMGDVILIFYALAGLGLEFIFCGQLLN